MNAIIQNGRKRRIDRRKKAFPKPRHRTPTLPPADPEMVAALVGRMTPAMRLALQWIVDHADVVQAGDREFLLVEASDTLIDLLATVGADAEDLEDGSDAEADMSDLEPEEDGDTLAILCAARQRRAAAAEGRSLR